MKKRLVLTDQGNYVKNLFNVSETDSVEISSSTGSFKYDLFSDGNVQVYSGSGFLKVYSFTKILKDQVAEVEVVYDIVHSTRKDLVLYDGTISSSSPVKIDLTQYNLKDTKFYIYVNYEGSQGTITISSGKFINGNFDYADVKTFSIGNTNEGIAKRFVVGFFNFDDVMKITTTVQTSFGIKVIVCKEE